MNHAVMQNLKHFLFSVGRYVNVEPTNLDRSFSFFSLWFCPPKIFYFEYSEVELVRPGEIDLLHRFFWGGNEYVHMYVKKFHIKIYFSVKSTVWNEQYVRYLKTFLIQENLICVREKFYIKKVISQIGVRTILCKRRSICPGLKCLKKIMFCQSSYEVEYMVTYWVLVRLNISLVKGSKYILVYWFH